MNTDQDSFQKHVAEFLRNNWNPWQEGSEAEHAYFEKVVALVRARAAPKELAQFFVETESASLGYRDTEPEELIPLASRLLKLNRA